MSVYKDTKNNTWKVYYRFTDWQGKVHQSTKRGFSTKREALAWEREQLHKVEADLDMTFESFIDTYRIGKNDRLFEVTKSYLHHEMDRGAKAAGVKRIRIHDLRHSHISLLIEMGYSAVAIADRVGHESINITYNYAHLFPSTQSDMADKLNQFRKDGASDVIEEQGRT